MVCRGIRIILKRPAVHTLHSLHVMCVLSCHRGVLFGKLSHRIVVVNLVRVLQVAQRSSAQLCISPLQIETVIAFLLVLLKVVVVHGNLLEVMLGQSAERHLLQRFTRL